MKKIGVIAFIGMLFLGGLLVGCDGSNQGKDTTTQQETTNKIEADSNTTETVVEPK